MPTTLLAISLVSLAIWLYLAVARGMFWRLSDFDDDLAKHEPPTVWPSVIAIVPARNENATIHQAVTSLLQQNYPGEFSIVVVDDHSEDATAQIAQQAATGSKIEIHPAAPLPPGWTGKLWALNEGISHSLGGTAISGCAPTTSISLRPASVSRTTEKNASTPILPPTYYWFTDADIVHAPDTLRRLVVRAEHNNLDLTSLMVLLRARTFPERATIPAFLFFFLKLYPPRWIANPRANTAGAAGGCILLKSEALQRIGGLAAIRSEVIDDCALARAVKVAQPFLAVFGRSPSRDLQASLPDQEIVRQRLWMGVTRASLSLRAYTTFAEIRDMIARTAFTQLHYSPLVLLGTLFGMFLAYLAPVALLFAPSPAPRILAASTWLLMSFLYLPTIRFYRQFPLWALTLPLTALFYSYATFLSAARYYSGHGAHWKGRSQASRTV